MNIPSREFIQRLTEPRTRASLTELGEASGDDRMYWSRVRSFLLRAQRRDARMVRVARLLGLEPHEAFTSDDPLPNVRAALSQATAAGPYTMHPLDPAMLRDLFPPRRRGAHKRRAW